MDYKIAIKEKGLMIKWVAAQLGISNVTLSYFLNNTRPMPQDIEDKLKEILK